jgi:hypothetical protein
LHRAEERVTLVRALSALAVLGRRKSARRFLQGLSNDELRYMAGYMGACIIEWALSPRRLTRCELASEIQEYECCRMVPPGMQFYSDLEHKMILLLEYLSACGCAAATRVTAGSA